MEITIKEYENYEHGEIMDLYKSVGWCSYTSRPEMLEHAFEHSLKILGAHDCEKLIGIVRAVGDGYSIVFIQDILVLPEYQRKGIGKKLINTMLECYPDVYQIELATDNTEKTVSFYKACGFTSFSEMGCEGFMKIKY
ncbi:MAG: GNAT family N-acetyltransferase [Oscillospiraceae bacterium]|nr:GNAT family N-acetyltransferase [Oscillospiraceae bacterium]